MLQGEDRLRKGKMGLGVAFANMHSGLMGAEEANRLNYLGHEFRRKWNLSSAVAFQNDVPGFTWAYPRVFAGSGVKRLVTGLNLFIGGGNSLGVSQNPFYWTGPDGFLARHGLAGFAVGDAQGEGRLSTGDLARPTATRTRSRTTTSGGRSGS